MRRRVNMGRLRPVGIIILVGLFLTACATKSASPTPAVSSDIMWTKTDSPLLPLTWPPTPDTVWVRYTFAYGVNPTLLQDGNYVTAPLSKTEWKAGRSTVTVLTENMTQVGVQGIVPLTDASRRALEAGAQVSDFCLTLTALPDLTQSDSQTMLAYYKAWFQYNGAFLNLVRAGHVDFIAWVEQNS